MNIEKSTFTRTELTEHETEILYSIDRRIWANAFEVGSFVTRHGRIEDFKIADDLYASLLAELDADIEVRIGAMLYELFFAENYRLQRLSQAEELCEDFKAMLYRNAIANRKEA